MPRRYTKFEYKNVMSFFANSRWRMCLFNSSIATIKSIYIVCVRLEQNFDKKSNERQMSD